MAKLDFPVATADGQVWTGTNGVIYTYVGTPPNGYWQGITGEYAQDSNANIHVGDTPPPDPEPGNLWWDSSNDSGRLYMFYEDVDSSQWVEASPSGTGEDGEDSEPTLWDKNGNDLEPKVVTDNVVIGGDKITLNSDGTGTFANRIVSDYDGTNFAIEADLSSSGNPGGLLIKNEQTGSAYPSIGVQSSDGASYPYTFIVRSGGGVEIGGDLNSSPQVPNISLNANGSATFGGGHTTDDGVTIVGEGQVKVRGDNLSESSAGFAIYRNGSSGTSIISRLNYDGSAEFDGDVKIGGTLPSAPNIALLAGGQIKVTAPTSAPNNPAILLSDNNGINIRLESNGRALFGGTLSDAGSEQSGANIELNADGSATFKNTVKADTRFSGNGSCFYAVAQSTSLDSAGVKILNGVTPPGSGWLLSGLGPNAVSKIKIDNDGQIFSNHTTINTISSERRLKENIVAIDADTAWETIKSTPYYTYNFIDNPITSYGPMADEVPSEMRIPTDRSDDEGPIRTYDNGMLQARLYTALQTALTRIEALETTNASLEARLTALEGAN